MPYNASGSFAPAILEPYPVQTEIAKEMMSNSPGLAVGLSGLYNEMHNVGEAQYGAQFQQMRQMQLANLQQQMMDNAVRAIDVTGKVPGAFDFISHAYPGLLGQADQGAVSQFSGVLGRNNQLTNLKTALDAAKLGDESGNTIPIGTLSGLTNLPLVPTTPRSTINSEINAAGRAAGRGPEMMTIPIDIGELDASGHSVKTPVRLPIFADDATKQQYIDAARRALHQTQGDTPNVPGAPKTPGAGSGQDVVPGKPPSDPNDPNSDMYKILTGPLPGGTGTNLTPNNKQLLPPAQQDTPAPGTAPGGAPATPAPVAAPVAPIPSPAPATSNASAGSPGQTRTAPSIPQGDSPPNHYETGRLLQGRAHMGMATLPPATREAIQQLAARMGGNIPIRILNGVPMYIGPDGNPVGRVP